MKLVHHKLCCICLCTTQTLAYSRFVIWFDIYIFSPGQPTSIIILPFCIPFTRIHLDTVEEMCVCAHRVWFCASTFMFVRLSGARVTINAVSQALDFFKKNSPCRVLENTDVSHMQEWRRRYRQSKGNSAGS